MWCLESIKNLNIKGTLRKAVVAVGVLLLMFVFIQPLTLLAPAPGTEMEEPTWWRNFMCGPSSRQPSDTLLPRLILDTVPRRNDTNVFLLDTACNPHPRYRAWCSVESWARQNPGLDVWYLLTSLTTNDSDGLISFLLHQYSNLKLASLNLDKMFQATPLQPLFNSKRWTTKNTWPVEVLSDMLRVLVLWHWGGVYSDTDVFSIKNFTIPINAVGLEGQGVIASAFLSFRHHHPVLWTLMEDMNKNFKPQVWGSIGPHAITRVMRGKCKNDTILNNTDGAPQSCSNITIYPTRFFSPVPWRQSQRYIAEGKGKNFVMDFSSSDLIHFWNKLTKNKKVRAGSKSVYDVAAKTFCPVTYRLATLRSDLI